MKKFFFLALMAFLWLPATTWASGDEHSSTESDSGDAGNGDIWDDEQEENLGTIVPTSVQLEYRILTAPQGTVGDMNYVNGTVELEGIYGILGETTNVGALYIPHEIQVVTVESLLATVSLYDVVGIGVNAFRVGDGYGTYNNTVTSVSIPYTVTSIGDYAFADNSNITSIVFAADASGNSYVETIGAYAFSGGTFSEINLPSTATGIGEGAFYGCANLTSIVLPDDLTTMSTSLFKNCTSLTTVTSSGNITSLGGDVFADCPALTTLVFTSSSPNKRAGSSLLMEDDPFLDDSEDNVTVYVPTGSAAAWEATLWNSLFTNETNVHISWNFFSTNVSSAGWDGSNTYYATYYVDEAGYILDGGTAYYVSGIEDGVTEDVAIEGLIPAGTAILIGSSATGDYYFYKEYESTNTEATITGNMLYGSNVDVTTVAPDSSVEYYFYKLSRNADGESGSVGFYWNDSEGGAFTSAAYKAYLAVPQDEANGLSNISFKKDEGDTTGISAVESASEAKTVKGIYTLQGVRVSDMSQKGVYIVDGKKVLVK